MVNLTCFVTSASNWATSAGSMFSLDTVAEGFGWEEAGLLADFEAPSLAGSYTNIQ